MLTASAVAVLLPSLMLAAPVAPAAQQEKCAVVDSIGRCLVSAVDPGRPGAAEARERKRPERSAPRSRTPGPGSGVTPPGTPPSAPADPLATDAGQGQQPDGQLDELLAEAQNAVPGGAAEPAPEVLALRAVEQLELPAPTVHTSGEEQAVVGVPLWLWVDRDQAFTGPVSATATAGAAQVTAEARFARIEWSMGPPGELVRCDGPGTPWTGQIGPSPDCGYTYRQRSLAERTAGTGRWTVVATAVWSVTWTGFSAGAPVTGEQELRVPTTTTLPVGEVQVLVDGDGS